MNNIYLIVGPSGSGKTTLAENLERAYGYSTVRSYTDRPPRGASDTSHTFVSTEEFDQLGKLVAYTKYNGHQYGVPEQMVNDCDTYVIDPFGVNFLKEHYRGPKGIVVIGLLVTEQSSTWRQLHRGDSAEAVTRRVDVDKVAFDSFVDICDHTINTDLYDPFLCQVIANHIITVEETKSNGLKHNDL